jgi:hypothetical protein
MNRIIQSTICGFIAIIIVLLPIIVLIFRFSYPKQYLLYVNDKNKNAIIKVLKEDDFIVDNPNFKKIELIKPTMSRYSTLKITFDDNNFVEQTIKNDNHDYKIMEYLKNNAVNIEKILLILNYISILPIIFIILQYAKSKK